MKKITHAKIDPQGTIHFQEPVEISHPTEALVFFLNEHEDTEIKQKATNIPNWIGKYSSQGQTMDDRRTIYE